MTDRQKDIFIRAGKTFLQALLATAITQLMAVLSADGVNLDPKALAATVGIPAIAAGLSAIQNALFPPAKPSGNDDDTVEPPSADQK